MITSMGSDKADDEERSDVLSEERVEMIEVADMRFK